MAGWSEWSDGLAVRAVVWRHSEGAGVVQEGDGNLVRGQTVLNADAVREKGTQ